MENSIKRKRMTCLYPWPKAHREDEIPLGNGTDPRKQDFKNEQQNDHTRLGMSLSICNAKKSEVVGKNINRVSILNNIYLPILFQLTGVIFLFKISGVVVHLFSG